MKPYVLRRLGMVDPRYSETNEKPRLFSTKGYLSDLDAMIQTEYVAQLKGASGGEAMVRMLVDLELKERER